MSEEIEKDYIISTHPLISGRKVAPGWWTSKEDNIQIKDMTDEHLSHSISYLKNLIEKNTGKPEDEYPQHWINMNLYVLEQLLVERDSRISDSSEMVNLIMARAGMELPDEMKVRKERLAEFDQGFKDGYDGEDYKPTSTSYIEGHESGKFNRKRFNKLTIFEKVGEDDESS